MDMKKFLCAAVKKENMQKVSSEIKKTCRFIRNNLAEHKEQIGYYSALVIVLIALSAAAYDYRLKKTSSIDQPDRVTEVDMLVQSRPDPTLAPEESEPAFILPVQGEIIQAFSDEELLWSTTLQLWQTHPAIDISASFGEAVVACADGKVVETYQDALYGNTIVIDHGDSILIRYRSLNTLELAAVEQSVSQGEVIGSAGTCNAEANLGAHIHLECSHSGENTDFFDLLSE